MASSHEAMKEAAENHWQNKDIAEKYKIAENATFPYAQVMAKKARLDKSEDISAFDFACGTGAVTAALYEALPKEKWEKMKVFGGDVSQPMLDYLKERGQKEGWTGLSTGIVDAADIQLPPAIYTHSFVNFGIFMMPPTTLSTLHSLLKPDGFIAISSWSYLSFHPMVARAIAAIPNPPPCPSKEEVMAFLTNNQPWNEPTYIEKVLTEAGFKEVETEYLEYDAECGTPDQFAEAMFMPMKLMSSFWEQSERERLLGEVSAKFLEIVKEDFGTEGPAKMLMKGIVASGRKAA